MGPVSSRRQYAYDWKKCRSHGVVHRIFFPELKNYGGSVVNYKERMQTWRYLCFSVLIAGILNASAFHLCSVSKFAVTFPSSYSDELLALSGYSSLPLGLHYTSRHESSGLWIVIQSPHTNTTDTILHFLGHFPIMTQTEKHLVLSGHRSLQ